MSLKVTTTTMRADHGGRHLAAQQALESMILRFHRQQDQHLSEYEDTGLWCV
jgi:hypothetical protein